MDLNDLGSQVSYLALDPKTLVFASDGELVGEVAFVLDDPHIDIFDGVVIHLHADHARGLKKYRFVDVAQVSGIYERGVVLTVDSAATEGLPEPTKNPPAMHLTPDDFTKQTHEKLRRAWDRISGKG